MAFDVRHFQFARGVDSSYAQGSGVTLIAHSYKSDEDTITTITTPGYFPPYIDGIPDDKIFPDDQIMITGTDETVLVNILTANPVTLSANLFATGGAGFTIGSPVLPVDPFGMTLVSDVLSLEYASVTYPGIVSVADQAFSGEKTFVDHVHIGTGFSGAGGAPNNLQILSTETLGGVNLQTNVSSNILQYSFGSPTIPSVSYAGIEWKQVGFGPEAPSPEVAIYNNSGIGLKINTSQECIIPVGIRFGLGTNSILNTYTQTTFNSTFNDGATSTATFTFTVNRVNNMIFLSLQNTVSGVASATPGNFYASNTPLPVALRPSTSSFCPFYIFNSTGSVNSAGLAVIQTTGTINIYWSATQTIPYPTSAAISFFPGTMTYSLI